MISNEFLDAVKGLVMNTNANVMVVNLFGDVRAYLVNSVRMKSRETPYVELKDAKDITQTIKYVQGNFATGMTEQTLQERTQSVPLQDLKFGTDEFIWVTRVVLNQDKQNF